MKRVLLSLLLALGAAGIALAQTATPVTAAGTPGNQYSATVPVAGTSDADRNAAIVNALAQVLRQVSPGFSATPDVLAQASGYVRNFQYRRAASGSGLELQVDFDPGAIGRLTTMNPGNAAPGGAGQGGNPATGASTATAAAQGGSGTLWVDGIGDSRAFASLLATLRGDTALRNVTPVAAAGDGVLLRLDIDQPLATVLAGLSGPGGHLAPAAQAHQGADASMRWVP